MRPRENAWPLIFCPKKGKKMNIIEDTRQQAKKHEIKHKEWDAMGVGVVRSALPFGDYCLAPKIVVDTKRNIGELAANVSGGKEHVRFRAEITKANSMGCEVFFLVENNDGIKKLDKLWLWKNPRLAEWRRKVNRGELSDKNPPISGAKLMAACKSMQIKYGCRFYFCAPEESAHAVLELLS